MIMDWTRFVTTLIGKPDYTAHSCVVQAEEFHPFMEALMMHKGVVDVKITAMNFERMEYMVTFKLEK